MVGQTLGHYKILEKLGAGGMGEVYLAEDSTLKRKVALKVLPAELAEDQERLDRFQREAETLAALDHPNIVHIYTVEEADGLHFLTMQLVEGRRLADLISSEGMPLERILEIATPLASALADAHEHGVIHRDLKPANIMISDQGRVKILDFGLAKLRQASETEMASQLPTEPLTEEGRLLGTAPYMSPEQIEGKPLDSRSDIFSLGIVIYEMASGHRPFQGESSTSTMARILETEPEQLGELRSDLPTEFLRIVRRCLRKQPRERYNDTRDLLVALKDLKQDSSSQYSSQITRGGEIPESPRHTSRRLLWVLVPIVLILVVLALILASSRFLTTTSAPSVARHQQITFTGDATAPEISPDGAFLAYVSRTGVTLHDLEGGGAIELLEFSYPSDLPPNLRWSTDGLRLIVSGSIDGERFSLVVPRLGGQEQRLPFYGYTCWAPDDSRIAHLYQNRREIYLVDLDSGEIAERIPISGDYRWTLGFDWSIPLNRFLVITTRDDESYAIRTLTADGSGQTTVFEADREIRSARWSLNEPTIYFLQASGQSSELWKVAVSPKTGEADGPARALQTGLQAGESLSVSGDGPKLAYARTVRYSSLWQLDVDPTLDRPKASKKQLLSGTSPSLGFSVSPNGSRLALARGEEDSDIFVLSLEDGEMRQVTSLEGSNFNPVWSPDGGRIAFASTHEDQPRVWLVRADGGNPQVLPTGELSISGELAWSPGERLVYQKPANDMFHTFDIARNSDDPLLSELLSRTGWYFDPVYSMDGNKIALHANLGGPTLMTVSARDRDQTPTILARQSERFNWAFYQEIDAGSFRGQEVKLQAQVRAANGGQGRIFLSTLLEDGGWGAPDRQGTPITSSGDWADLELTAKIEDDAAVLLIGGLLNGPGVMWADDFSLSVFITQGQWETLPVENPSFEELSPSGEPMGWRIESSNLVSYSVSSEVYTHGQRSMTGRELAKPAEGDFYPVGWSLDDRFIYLISGSGEPVMYRIPASGGEVRPYIDLELSNPIRGASFSREAETIVIETVNEQTDVWVSEGFDPDLQ